jgi:hypothetical protein
LRQCGDRHEQILEVIPRPSSAKRPSHFTAAGSNFGLPSRLSTYATDRVRENIQTLDLQAYEHVNLEAARTYPLEKQAAFRELVQHFSPAHAD